ncbi:competence type IV pilus ATPase ComGA [Dolosicoccus paucivorans]|uniref:General secretion pathway protein GspE n=1 Tax=Dolosicoccus paucivorans TaxID=84521 RepID=A0A1G8IXD4_9LACT|nr:competence type IV pilus ATPase ComGA [Dolosicoccus paucivorans]PMB84668.1 general secretion pathway protein GspE [Dolosicoccus paucivorans]PMC59228.1 general secretion pathway protein GspE [Dolosicoccus paucivorans]SDI23644.1 competence protein ComGA [Dolosicoccus paucivorans]
MEKDGRRLIEQAVHLGVSDIHIVPSQESYLIYFRLNGNLELESVHSLKWGQRLINYFKFLSDMDTSEKRRPQSGSVRFQLHNEPKEVELRFSTITNVELWESLVIRVIQTNMSVEGGVHSYFKPVISSLEQLIRRKSGLILFSGPVGSGKTTTIYQLLTQYVDEYPLQVITMEDPVEIYEPRFLQVEVNEKAGVTYQEVIKASLRHHPDILMIGEIRDEQTARMAIRGALTGHLMIATIHAKNTLGVMGRLEELGLTKEQLAQTLIGVISQRLVPKFCPLCQGPCQRYCTHFDQTKKRGAVFELLEGDALKQVLLEQHIKLAYQITLNYQLKRLWAYGYIDTLTYQRFEVI